MWLINTTTLELHNFLDARAAPPYAILSHCWGKDEMNFKDFRKTRNCRGSGYQKIVDSCRVLRNSFFEIWTISGTETFPIEELKWIWIDTM